MAKRGRTSIYDSKIAPFLKQIEEAVQNGATLGEIGKSLGVSESTLRKYKSTKKELTEAFAHGRACVIMQIRGALLKKALGYEYEERKEYSTTDENGKTVTRVEVTRRHQPPSETAGAMLLRNYDEGWLDKDSITTQLKQQELELRKAIAKDNAFDNLEV